jgi:tetratricopeptide (TPR) repeat protein
VEQLDCSIEAYLGARRDSMNQVQKLLADDPECPLGHCLAGYLQMHRVNREAVQAAKQSLLQARQFARMAPLNAREKLHVLALEAWIGGDHVAALACWEAILAEYPRDILAIRLAQFMTSYLGNSQAICDSIDRVFTKWDAAVPGYSYLLGCYAYGLEESGNYRLAEHMGRSAIDLNPHDLWAAHAVAHVMEMQGRPRDGIAWVAELEPQWLDCGNFVLHLKWHCALFYLALQEFDRVLMLYDRKVRAESTDEYLDIANAASMLWRLEQAGINVGPRWQELAERAAQRLDEHLFVFADLHYAIAAAAGSSADAQRFLQSCSAFAKSGNGTQAGVMEKVGLAIVRAITAHRRGSYAEAVELLLPQRNNIHLVGGSRAQRDTFEQLLIDSAIRAHNFPQARLLLAERTAERPHDLWSWKAWADLANATGNREDAAMARR